jgi:hypothetical protein
MRGFLFEIPRAAVPKARALIGQPVTYERETYVVVRVSPAGAMSAPIEPILGDASLLIRKPRDERAIGAASVDVIEAFEPIRVLPWPED